MTPQKTTPVLAAQLSARAGACETPTRAVTASTEPTMPMMMFLNCILFSPLLFSPLGVRVEVLAVLVVVVGCLTPAGGHGNLPSRLAIVSVAGAIEEPRRVLAVVLHLRGD